MLSEELLRLLREVSTMPPADFNPAARPFAEPEPPTVTAEVPCDLAAETTVSGLPSGVDADAVARHDWFFEF